MLSRHVQLLARATVVLAAVPAGAALARAPQAVTAAVSPTALSASAPQCHGARAASAGSRAEHTIVCLINAQRARHRLPRLVVDARLARAARRHARDMVRRRYFDHDSPNGSSPMSRAAAEGYHATTLGEDLAFGTGQWGTPAGSVAQWLSSAPHRRTLLSRRLRDVGVGAASGPPLPDYIGGVTVSATFARR